MEKLEGEEHTAKVFQDRTNKAKQEIDDLTKATEEMRESISKLEGHYFTNYLCTHSNDANLVIISKLYNNKTRYVPRNIFFDIFASLLVDNGENL